MSDLNKVMLIGRLGRDPEVKALQSGEQVATLSLATGDKWKDKATGEPKEKTEWHRCVAFGKLAEIIGKYCTKGKQIYAEGSLRTRKWTDKQGVEKYTTEIVLQSMQLLGGGEGRQEPPTGDPPRTGGNPARSRPATGTNGPDAGAGKEDFDDDIPF